MACGHWVLLPWGALCPRPLLLLERPLLRRGGCPEVLGHWDLVTWSLAIVPIEDLEILEGMDAIDLEIVSPENCLI